MPAFNPRVFTNPARLKEIHPDHLLRFLSQWDSYFAERGLDLASVDRAEITYDQIAAILMNPGTGVSDGMVNALYFVHETARKEPMDELIERAKELIVEGYKLRFVAENALERAIKMSERSN